MPRFIGFREDMWGDHLSLLLIMVLDLFVFVCLLKVLSYMCSLDYDKTWISKPNSPNSKKN